jgi:hypothetical protein
MGLHALIHQYNREVSIALRGEIRRPECDQLRAILSHFHRRGCRTFVLDLSQISPLSPAAKDSLNTLIGQPGLPTTPLTAGHAVRLLTDSVSPPPTGRNGLPVSQ